MPVREFQGFRRPSGQVGVRDRMLVIPSVVCANQAAWAIGAWGGTDVTVLNHPLGCGQLGADREQTLRALVGMGSHPNVRGTLVVGLGCEGIPAEEIFRAIADRKQAVACCRIQDEGGVEATIQRGQMLWQDFPGPGLRTVSSVEELTVGLSGVDSWGSAGHDLVAALLDRGIRVIEAIEEPGEDSDVQLYAEYRESGPQYTVMRASGSDQEVMTGLAATGAHILLAPGTSARWGSQAVVPVVRIAAADGMANPRLIDGVLSDRTAQAWVDWLIGCANGEESQGERLAPGVFAIAQCGPVV